MIMMRFSWQVPSFPFRRMMSIVGRLTTGPGPCVCSLSVLALLVCSCQPESSTRHYLFLGHPYDWHHPYEVDPRLEKMDYSVYDEIWLGGDVCSRTAEVPETMGYLDSLFDFSRVRWALGNHDVDYGDPENVYRQLPHPPFFTEWKEGFCLTVINTNYFWPYPAPPPQRNCAEKQAQWEMIQSVADTIKEASHWVVLHHHAMFSDLKVTREGDTLQTFNVNPMVFYASCDSSSTITEQWYPEFLKAQGRGVEVVLIGGDVGMQAKRTAFQTAEGIWLLGSGINNSVPKDYAPDYVKDFGPDEVLKLTYDQQAGTLDWEFELLSEK